MILGPTWEGSCRFGAARRSILLNIILPISNSWPVQQSAPGRVLTELNELCHSSVQLRNISDWTKPLWAAHEYSLRVGCSKVVLQITNTLCLRNSTSRPLPNAFHPFRICARHCHPWQLCIDCRQVWRGQTKVSSRHFTTGTHNIIIYLAPHVLASPVFQLKM